MRRPLFQRSSIRKQANRECHKICTIIKRAENLSSVPFSLKSKMCLRMVPILTKVYDVRLCLVSEHEKCNTPADQIWLTALKELISLSRNDIIQKMIGFDASKCLNNNPPKLSVNAMPVVKFPDIFTNQHPSCASIYCTATKVHTFKKAFTWAMRRFKCSTPCDIPKSPDRDLNEIWTWQDDSNLQRESMKNRQPERLSWHLMVKH